MAIFLSTVAFVLFVSSLLAVWLEIKGERLHPNGPTLAMQASALFFIAWAILQ